MLLINKLHGIHVFEIRKKFVLFELNYFQSMEIFGTFVDCKCRLFVIKLAMNLNLPTFVKCKASHYKISGTSIRF